MAQSWGRDAVVSIDGTNITKTQDITPTDEAEDLMAKARDMGVNIHHQGSKEIGVDFQRLLQDTNPTDQALLLSKYDSGANVAVVVRRKAGGIGFQFTGVVLKASEGYPMEGASMMDVMIRCSDETSFARVAAV